MQPTDAPRPQPLTPEAEMERVSLQVTGQLSQRGVRTHDDDPPEALADMLTAVERFEEAVRLCGGDSFTNRIGSSRPDDRKFVIPQRRDDESADAYVRRVQAAAVELQAPERSGPHPGSAI